MHFSKTNMRNPLGVLNCPIAAAATFTHDYNITELTEKIGCRSNKTLLSKLNNDSDFHHLTLQEAVSITGVTEDLRIVEAWAYGLGYRLLPLTPSIPSDEEFSDQLLELAERKGDFCRAMREARADGVISKQDLAEIKQEAAKLVKVVQQLELECEAMVREIDTQGAAND